MQRHYTMIEGKKYVVILGEMPDVNGKPAPIVWVRSVRINADNTETEAFLSNRQWKAESRAKTRFAKEINEHLAKFK